MPVVAGLFLLIGAREAAAASTNWTGSAGDGKWETGGNWSNGVPGANGVVTITTGSVGVNANTSSLTSLTVSGGTLTLNGTSALNVNGTGTPFFTLSGGSFNGAGGSLTVSGDVTVSGTATYQAPSGTSAISGNLTMTGGTYAGAGTTNVSKNVDVSVATSSDDPTLVGYWSFDDTGATNHGADSSGNGNTVTWTGPPTFPTTNLPALSFDPTNPYGVAMTGQATNATATQYGKTGVLSGISVLRPTTVSLTAWYKATSVDKVASEIVSGSNTYALRITSTGLVVMKQVNNSTVGTQWIEYQVPFSNVLDGNWHQIVGVITTGTGGSMTAYLDGGVATGIYAAGGTTTPLTNTTSPTATAAAAAAIYWSTGSQNTESFGLTLGYNPTTTGYNFGANFTGGSTSKKCGASDSSTTSICAIDDVRVYNRALTAADVAALYHGSQPASSEGVMSLGGTLNATGSVTIESTGTLTLASGSTLGVGTSASNGLIVDGTLNATGGTITMSGSTRYPFVVGSTSTAAPTLNISTLSVQNVDTNGVQINGSGGSSTSASTTITQFDKVTFGNGAGGTQNQLLNIFASSLNLVSNGCTFGSGSTYAVKLTSTASSGTGPRALFGNATCPTNDATTPPICATSEKQDNDTCVSGVCTGVPTTSTGGVVQFIRAAESDTDGTLVGFPTAAFDWSSFSYYSTYVTFHNASGGNDTIYVRDESGNPLYSWNNSADKISGTDETIVGTPGWTTDSSSGKHYVYVAVNGAAANTGGVYRLLDTPGTSSLALDGTWSVSGTGSGAGWFACQCTITSALTLDASNIYFGATTASGTKVLFGIKQLDGSAIKTGWPETAPSTVTTSAPTIVTSTGMLYLGSTATLAQLNLSTLAWGQDNPASIGTITGRVTYGTSLLTATIGTSRIFVGDSGGSVWAINPGAFVSSSTVTTSLWKYTAGSVVTDNYYDDDTDTVMFGTAGGALVALTGAGSAGAAAVVNSSYPYTLPNSDSVSTAPLYYQGVVVVGSSKGNLYFLDRNTGNTTAPNGVKILKEVNFGPTESVSTIGFDTTVSRYMVSTSSAANDGRIYYFDLVADPTSSSQ